MTLSSKVSDLCNQMEELTIALEREGEISSAEIWLLSKTAYRLVLTLFNATNSMTQRRIEND